MSEFWAIDLWPVLPVIRPVLRQANGQAEASARIRPSVSDTPMTSPACIHGTPFPGPCRECDTQFAIPGHHVKAVVHTAPEPEPVTVSAPKPTRTILVQCTYTLPVEVPADWDEDLMQFGIEENSCPATGYVGAALEKRMAEQDTKGYCWACGLDAENKIVDLNPSPKKP